MITPILSPVEINNSDDAERAMASLVECRTELNLIDSTLAEAVNRAGNLAAQEAAPIKANITILEKALENFARANRDRICVGKRKSLKLTCGIFGFKSKTDLVAEDWAEVAAALAEAEYGHLLNYKDPEPDKTALAKLDDEFLATFGVGRKTVETFYVNPAVAKVAETGGEL